ncbi:hypothetical protein V1521DRAFT_121695 [Lipomyces starkeyi]
MFTNAMEQIRRDTPHGPYCYDGHNWLENYILHFFEVYQRDLLTDTILPCNKYPIVQQGRIVVQGDSLDLGVTIGDLYPPDEEQIGDVRSEPVQLEVSVGHLVFLSQKILRSRDSGNSSG